LVGLSFIEVEGAKVRDRRKERWTLFLRTMQNTIYPCKHLFTAISLAVFFRPHFAHAMPTPPWRILFNATICVLISRLSE
jgi:hypothetical protein